MLVEIQKERDTAARPRCRWVDITEVDLRKIGWGDMDWIDKAQDRDQWWALVETVMNLQVA
jgi:hypothetical protein